jgi:ubiquinone/menaquinone biosynthesis C-methylase UbiE
MMNTAIRSYYGQVAPDYGRDRFANSYGRYLHRQETAILECYLGPAAGGEVLDLACGIGRFMKYCTTGADISPEMILVSREKHPGKTFTVQHALETAFPQGSFDAVICFHLLMHLDWHDLPTLLWEVARITKAGGRLIFDVPSAERRQLLCHQQQGWHGTNAYTHDGILDLLGTIWRLVAVRGIAALPVHRLPVFLRGLLGGFDDLLCQSPLRKLASYHAYVIEKR